MQAHYYLDQEASGKDQLIFSLPTGQMPNRGFRASDGEYVKDVNFARSFPLFRILPDTQFACRPLFIRTVTGAAVLVISGDKPIILAESVPGVSQTPVEFGFDLAVPNLLSDYSNRISFPQIDVKSCVDDFERKARVLSVMNQPISMIGDAAVVKVAKMKSPFLPYEQADQLLIQKRILTYVPLETGRNSIFLFVTDLGETFLTLLYWDKQTNTVHPPRVR